MSIWTSRIRVVVSIVVGCVLSIACSLRADQPAVVVPHTVGRVGFLEMRVVEDSPEQLGIEIVCTGKGAFRQLKITVGHGPDTLTAKPGLPPQCSRAGNRVDREWFSKWATFKPGEKFEISLQVANRGQDDSVSSRVGGFYAFGEDGRLRRLSNLP
ncbi:MAG: hypothetical protein M3P51_08710 [Chloroflexota bacterium]|nr:hypothetical protein [Chloroflexota bacterium]